MEILGARKVVIGRLEEGDLIGKYNDGMRFLVMDGNINEVRSIIH